MNDERSGLQALLEEVFEFSREGQRNKIRTAVIALFVTLIVYGKLKKYGVIGEC